MQFPRVQARASPCSQRQSILMMKEMLFDYLIAIVAQTFADVAQIEVHRRYKTILRVWTVKRSKTILQVLSALKILFGCLALSNHFTAFKFQNHFMGVKRPKFFKNGGRPMTLPGAVHVFVYTFHLLVFDVTFVVRLVHFEEFSSFVFLPNLTQAKTCWFFFRLFLLEQLLILFQLQNWISLKPVSVTIFHPLFSFQRELHICHNPIPANT